MNLSGEQGIGAGREAEFEPALLRALEHTPEPAIPVDFAARVAALAAAQAPLRRSPWSAFGPRIALGSAALLTVALFAFAPHVTPSFGSPRFGLEMLLLAELGGIGWLAGRLASAD